MTIVDTVNSDGSITRTTTEIISPEQYADEQAQKQKLLVALQNQTASLQNELATIQTNIQTIQTNVAKKITPINQIKQ